MSSRAKTMPPFSELANNLCRLGAGEQLIHCFKVLSTQEGARKKVAAAYSSRREKNKLAHRAQGYLAQRYNYQGQTPNLFFSFLSLRDPDRLACQKLPPSLRDRSGSHAKPSKELLALALQMPPPFGCNSNHRGSGEAFGARPFSAEWV